MSLNFPFPAKSISVRSTQAFRGTLLRTASPAQNFQLGPSEASGVRMHISRVSFLIAILVLTATYLFGAYSARHES
jgi:hypothetical protein